MAVAPLRPKPKHPMTRQFLLFAILLVTTITGWAQNGTISGTVVDAKSNETIVGANVVIEGTAVGSATDPDGKFDILNVKPGVYNIVVSFVTYKTQVVPDVVVESGKKTTLTISLVEDIAELAEVVVQASREISSDVSLLNAIKESKLVVTGITAEQISRSQDRDAAQVVRRVPGVTLVDNRFVVVRGLSSRYSSIILNGVLAPSTETDTRAFSFDIIPSGLLDRMLVYKSGSAELPGEFAGSIVRVNTRSTVDENFTNISFSTGFRANTTFRDFNSQETAPTEFLGFDNGFRALPAGAPSNYNQLSSNPASLEQQSLAFKNSWGSTTRTAIPDLRFSVDLGRKFRVAGKEINSINSISYSNVWMRNTVDFDRYSNYSNGVGRPFFAFEDDNNTNQVRLGLLSNWMMRVGSGKIEFRNMYTRIGSNITTFRTGQDIDKGQDVQNGSFRYIGRAIYTGQVEGEHKFNDDRVSVNWLVGYTNANRNEPDWKRYSYRKNTGSEAPFELFVPTNAANPANAARFYQDLTEFNITNRLDIGIKLGEANDREAFELKTGYWAEYKDRNFAARQIGFVQRGFVPNTVFQQSIDQVFVPENIDVNNGFSVAENTNITDSYDANNLLVAGYAMATLPVSEKFRIVPGVRVEYNDINLKTAPGVGGATVDYPLTSILPFLNVSYNINTTQLVRLAYSKTVNRPEFRELAPFSFYDFDAQADIVGNSDLKVADIHNVDLRYEYYPTPSDFVSAGVFYKHFTNPIETRIVTGANNPIQFFQNAAMAQTAGVEVEVRKAVAYTSSSAFLNNLSVIFNAAAIWSEIDLGDQVTLTEAAKRPMQGQSPYIINAGLYYQNDKSGWQVSTQYNVFGKRIAFVGDREFPTQWEMPRHVIDLTIAKRLTEKTELRLGISDLLNAEAYFREDANLDNSVTSPDSDRTIRSTRFGQYVTLGIALRL